MKLFYKPTFKYLLIDIIMLIAWIFVVLQCFPLTTDTPFDKYSIPALYYIITWGVWSYVVGRYQPLKKQYFGGSSRKLFYTSVLILIFFHIAILIYFANKYSHNVLYTIAAGEFTLSYILLTVYFSYRYAVEYDDINMSERNDAELKKAEKTELIDEKSIAKVYETIQRHAGEKGLKYLMDNVKLNQSDTYVYASKNSECLSHKHPKQYSTVVQMQLLNKVESINKMLATINGLLPQEGRFICCFESKSTYKKGKLNSYLKGFGYFLYCIDFLFKRIFPKLMITRWFYYVFSGCEYRILSKAEVLGRLYCCGFKVEQEKKVGNYNFVIAKRIKMPDAALRRTYGPLIHLKRFGKDGKPFEVYKMRTMHPYSEFLQAYIYERNKLQDGGKFYKDIRVTTIGKYLRRYWLDELPMIFNVLKGEMKLVGVRPLSPHYFSLYDKELQQKRIKFKPGLLPPFYADMPKTLDEIQASEMRYLTLCENNSVLFTDFHYLILILRNIIIKKARSA